MELLDFERKYGGRSGAAGALWGGANGVYVVSPACPTEFWAGERCGNNVPRNVKIGKATGVNGLATSDGKGRLRNYRTYWPNGVTVHAVLITPSFDRTVHTIKDEASNRETTLRRIFKSRGLVGFGSNGRGGDNGTSHLGSEWIRLTPSEIMNYLIAVGPVRHARDKLYGCTKDQCERVHVDRVSRNVTRLNNVVKALEYVLEDENKEKKEKKLGVRGRPVVLPRTIIKAAKNKTHPLHIYSELLVSNVNKEMQLAQRRLADRKLRKAQAAEAQIAGERLTRIQRRLKRKRLNAMKQRLPRDLAALLPTKDFETAMELRAAKGVARKARLTRGAPAKKPPAKKAKKPPMANQDALNTIKRHPHHRRRYNVEKRAAARMLFDDLEQKANDFPSPKPKLAPEPKLAQCPLQASGMEVLYDYPNYTYLDVTADGRCYFYAIIKALGDPLHMEMGRMSDTNRYVGLGVRAQNYFNPTRKRFWKKELRSARWHDPIDVLYDSVKMGGALRNRGILYVAKLVRTRNDFSEVHAYMHDPIAQVRQSQSDGIYKINDNGSISLIPELTGRLRKTQDKEKIAAFNVAFREGRVVTFVWRNIPGRPAHYEVIIPRT